MSPRPSNLIWVMPAKDARSGHGAPCPLPHRPGVGGRTGGGVSAGDAEAVCRSARPPVDYRPHGTVLVGHDHDDLSRGTAASSC